MATPRVLFLVVTMVPLVEAAALAKDTGVCVQVIVKAPPESPKPPPPSTTAAAAPKLAASPQPQLGPPRPVDPDDDADSPDGIPPAKAPHAKPTGPLPPVAPPPPAAPLPSLPPSEEPAVPGNLPLGQTPERYLKRLLEHFVTHERGYASVDSGCQEHLVVELYPLRQGWTAFARVVEMGREERVDQLFPDELSEYSERVVTALLHDRSISTTILRDTVLRADSKRATQRIHGTSHFGIGLGTEIRGAWLPTAQADATAPARDQVRIFSPVLLSLFYRGKFESWGVETGGIVGIGTSSTGAQLNDAGGNIDYGGHLAFTLHFLRYSNPRGLTSFYFGAGATFEMVWLEAVLPKDQRTGTSDRQTLYSGGLDVDLLAGWEFMRASRMQFFLQGELQAPAYLVDNSEGPAPVKTWFPGVAIKIGMLF